MRSLRQRQSCFVAMPFLPKYNSIFREINKSVKINFYRCIRIDKEQFTQSIIAKVFSEIENAKLIIFLATDKNPNAFYECGYAVALNKEVITLSDVFENLPFDIRDRNAIAYGDNLNQIVQGINQKLTSLTRIKLK